MYGGKHPWDIYNIIGDSWLCKADGVNTNADSLSTELEDGIGRP